MSASFELFGGLPGDWAEVAELGDGLLEEDTIHA